ncbi:MAG: prolipoprotein diacylglyceryl transferase [Eubacteriales bacterium]|nr:prolipoprotein diacylglyceryl transferase [Eubacteriales bacterium]
MEMSIQFPNIGIELGHVVRSVNLFGYEITFYGILIAVGMILGISFVVLEAKRRSQNPNLYLGMILAALITGLIGARLFYVGFSWTLYRGNIQAILNISNGGLSIYGGMLGGALGAALFCKMKKASFWQMADTASMGLLIAQIIGRWGDFFNRESFGEYTDSIFAMVLPLSSVQSQDVSSLMRDNLAVIDGVSYIQVHPVFFYESVLCLILLLFLLASQRRKKFHGEIFMRYLSLYGLIRCFTEWLRTDKILFPGTKIPVSLAVSVFLFLFFGMEAMVRRSMEKKRAAARRRRREAFYAAEEQTAAELDRQDEERARLAAKKAPEPEKETVPEPEDDWDGTLPSERNQEKAAVPEDTASSDASESEDSLQERSSEEPESQPPTGSDDRGLPKSTETNS